jgi:MFS family permease
MGNKNENGFFEKGGFVAGATIVINTYSWFFPLYFLVEKVFDQTFEYFNSILLFGIFYVIAFLSPFAGVFIASRVLKRDKLLILWMCIGTVTSALSIFNLEIRDLNRYCLMFSLLGISLGLGFPSCLAYFADYNSTEKSGRNAGLVFLISGIGILLVGVITSILPVVISFVILALWRMVGCILFILGKPVKEKIAVGNVIPSYRQVVTGKKFALYFIPWVMCCVINYLEASLLKDFFGLEFSYFVPLAEFGIAGVIAVISGCISDLIGRKRIVVFGFVILGIGYALLGLFPTNTASWYFYVIADGIAWGVFAVMYFLLLWGELAENRQKEKYYLLGEMPYLVLSYIGILIKPYIVIISVSSAFSLASFFLFLAVVPLMYAPETLPERKLRERELRSYIEKAKKVKEKFT